MAVRDALQSAAIRLMGQKPSTFFTSTQKFELELVDLLNEVATDIAKSNDWQKLVRIQTMNGDGSMKDYALPADYDRMLVYSAMQDANNWVWGYTAVPDINTWQFLDHRNMGITPGYWIIYDNQIHVTPAPSTGSEAYFPYITKNWALSQDAVPKDRFTADSDTFLLPERLLTLALVWKWNEMKRLDGTGDQANFVKAFSEEAAKDKGSHPIISRVTRSRPGIGVAWPWPLGPGTY